jgi:hypothetical protein
MLLRVRQAVRAVPRQAVSAQSRIQAVRAVAGWQRLIVLLLGAADQAVPVALEARELPNPQLLAAGQAAVGQVGRQVQAAQLRSHLLQQRVQPVVSRARLRPAQLARDRAPSR